MKSFSDIRTNIEPLAENFYVDFFQVAGNTEALAHPCVAYDRVAGYCCVSGLTKDHDSNVHISAEDRERRLRKRRNAVLHVQKVDHRYALLLQLEEKMPVVPDCEDLSIPKRKWEKSVQDWRKILNAMYEVNRIF